jgi:hypothetical protein
MPITACQHLLLYVLTGRDGHSQCLALLSSSGPRVACLLTGPGNTGKCMKNGGHSGINSPTASEGNSAARRNESFR